MKLLVIGHSLVIDSNRKFWGTFAARNQAVVDVIAPREWSSNLCSNLSFQSNPDTDSELETTFTLKVFNKGNGSTFFFSPFKTFSILNHKKYDAIYLNQETWALSTLCLVFLKQISFNRKTRLLLCVAQNIKKKKLGFFHPYERFISRYIDSFLHCSQEVEDVLRWKGITTPSLYLPLPYDDEVYRPCLPEISSTTFTLGYLGRLSEDKGLAVLLEALDELNKRECTYRLLVGGNGPMVDVIKSKHYVTYLGLIPHNAAHQFYSKIDCFVLPSQTRPHWKEQFGRVIVETFGAGRPLIGSSSGAIPEVLGKIEWPWVFREDSPEELKTLILKLHHDLQTDAGRARLASSVDLNRKLFSQSEVALMLFEKIARV